MRINKIHSTLNLFSFRRGAVCHSHSIVQIHFFVKWHVSNARQLLNRATDSLETERTFREWVCELHHAARANKFTRSCHRCHRCRLSRYFTRNYQNINVLFGETRGYKRYAKLTLIFVLVELQRIIGATIDLSVQLMAIRWSILGHGKIQWLLINFIVCTMATI